MNTRMRITASGFSRRITAAAALCALLSGVSAKAQRVDRFVVKDNPDHAHPYDTLLNAAPDIQTAINAAEVGNGDEVVVAPGIYNSGGLTGFPAGSLLTNRVVVNKAITVRSLDNDPETTIIEGAWHPVTTNGPTAARGVYLGTNARLIGFTVRGSATFGSGNNLDQRGGGVYAEEGAHVEKCVVSHNSAQQHGGGMFTRATVTVVDCVIEHNVALGSGGGIWSLGASHDVCKIRNNYASFKGGGAAGGVYTQCIFSENKSGTSGAAAGPSPVGVAQIHAENTLFFSNDSGNHGGAVENGTYYNCLFYGNQAMGGSGSGGAAYGSGANLLRFYNCTIVGNYLGSSAAGHGGGGIYAANNATVTLVNTIVYDNKVRAGSSQGDNLFAWGTGTFTISNSCTYPKIDGWPTGNLTNAPMFVQSGSGFGLDHVPGNYQLTAASPCVDAGLFMDWMDDAVDLDNRARINPGSAGVDMGAYEYYAPGTLLLIR